MAERKKSGREKAGGKTGTRKRPASKKRGRAKLTLEEVTTDRYLTLIQGWYMDGATNQDVADRLHISRDTLYRWAKKSELLSDVMKCSREIADYKVENSLYKKAQGYTVTLKKPVKIRKDDYDEKGKRIGSHEEVVEVDEEVHIPADTAAIIFWLKNRVPEKWRQKDRETERMEEDGSGIVMMPSVLEPEEEEPEAENPEEPNA